MKSDNVIILLDLGSYPPEESISVGEGLITICFLSTPGPYLFSLTQDFLITIGQAFTIPVTMLLAILGRLIRYKVLQAGLIQQGLFFKQFSKRIPH